MTHYVQVDPCFRLILGVGIARDEMDSAEIGWVEPD
jgi:hypothetical protein